MVHDPQRIYVSIAWMATMLELHGQWDGPLVRRFVYIYVVAFVNTYTLYIYTCIHTHDCTIDLVHTLLMVHYVQI